MIENLKYKIIPWLTKKKLNFYLCNLIRPIYTKTTILAWFGLILLCYLWFSWIEELIETNWLFTRSGPSTSWHEGIVHYKDLNPNFNSKVLSGYWSHMQWFLAIIWAWTFCIFSQKVYFFVKKYFVIILSAVICIVDIESPFVTWESSYVFSEIGGAYPTLIFLGWCSYWMHETFMVEDTVEYRLFAPSIKTTAYRELVGKSEENSKEEDFWLRLFWYERNYDNENVHYIWNTIVMSQKKQAFDEYLWETDEQQEKQEKQELEDWEREYEFRLSFTGVTDDPMDRARFMYNYPYWSKIWNHVKIRSIREAYRSFWRQRRNKFKMAYWERMSRLRKEQIIKKPNRKKND